MLGECHAHIIMDAQNYKQAVSLHEEKPDDTPIYRHLEEYARRGIPFIRDGGDALFVSLRAKTLAQEYGIDYRTPVFAIHKNGHYGRIVGKGFDTMKEYRALVLEAKERGADFIKIMTTGIMDFNQPKVITGKDLCEEEVMEMVAVAHEEHLSVMSHTNGSDAVRIALKAGADSIEHGNFMDAETIHMLADSPAVWVPTITVVPNMLGCGRFPDEILLSIWERESQAILTGFCAGVKLAAGSDAGAYLVPHGQGLVDEISRLTAIIPQKDQLMERLQEGEQIIRQRFCPGGAH